MSGTIPNDLASRLSHLVSRDRRTAAAMCDPDGVHADGDFFTLSQIYRALRIDAAKSNPGLEQQIRLWLDTNDWARVKRRVHGLLCWGYERPARVADVADSDGERLAALLAEVKAAGGDFVPVREALQALGVAAITSRSITEQSVQQWMQDRGWTLVYRRGYDGAAWGFIGPRPPGPRLEMLGGRWLNPWMVQDLQKSTGQSRDQILATLPLQIDRTSGRRGPSPTPSPKPALPTPCVAIVAGVVALMTGGTILRLTRPWLSGGQPRRPAAGAKALR